jgi:hypothetical protein
LQKTTDKQARSFSLFPLCSLAMRYLTLDTTVLSGVLRRLAMRGECEHPEALKDFFGNKRAHWERLFDLTKAEGKSARRKFDYMLKTDDFGVSIGLVKPKAKPKAKAAALPNRAASPDEDPVDEEPVDEELVNEEPVDEEPVDEEPVDEEPVDEELVNK